MFLCTHELSTTWKKIGFELCSAIDYIRGRGMVHVDIKPANVFYVWQNRQPVVKLGDFGCVIPKRAPCFMEQRIGETYPAAPPNIRQEIGLTLTSLKNTVER
jgi:serine/threonine protein kinase